MMAFAASEPEEERPKRRRPAVTPVVEALVLGVAVAIAVTSYLLIMRANERHALLPPALVAVLLVANIVPGVALMILAGRRIARRRAARSPIGGEGRLHVRLVALFSVMAAVPMLLVAIFASFLLQYGVEFWSSARAQSLLDNASSIVRTNYEAEIDRVASQTRAMSGDLSGKLRQLPIDGPDFSKELFLQTLSRELSEAMIVREGERDPLIVLNPYGRPLENIVTPAMTDRINRGAPVITLRRADRTAAVVPIAYGRHTYLYAARVFDENIVGQIRRSNAVVADYKALQTRSRRLQLQFNAALLLLSLVIVGIAVWIALVVADRLVRPVGELVGAARRVAGGDLTARVAEARTRDEVGTLGRAFNQMTGRLQEQNGELLAANDQLDSRRALIEAVMAGVSAGVIAAAPDGTIRIANASADRLLGRGPGGLAGRRLGHVAPEFATLMDGGAREGVVQVGEGAEPRTLAVRVARTDTGPILTFDDITQQLLDQRRAAWSDVARRIAHEIKNPLTPIQLAAERLNRRYAGKIDPEDTTFSRLTDTIIRQVGDLRRMVDEFSSFARMPKPSFHAEPLVDTARQALFLHEVAHPGIRFALNHDDPGPVLVCDRRQIGQALTNIVKNAVEAVQAAGRTHGAVTMTLAEDAAAGTVTIVVEDDGVGLPADRDRILEPYVTTRARGTGLGLAIVNKIIEDHLGTMTFSDRAVGGAVVTMTFDAAALAALDEGEPAPDEVAARVSAPAPARSRG